MEAEEIPMTSFLTPPENSHVHIDHNLYIKDGYVYQVSGTTLFRSVTVSIGCNTISTPNCVAFVLLPATQAAYTAGARIRKIMPDNSLEEVAYIDLENLCECVNGPADPTCECNPFFGTWTYYPGWEWSSGISAAGSISQGLFLLKPDFKSIEKDLLDIGAGTSN